MQRQCGLCKRLGANAFGSTSEPTIEDRLAHTNLHRLQLKHYSEGSENTNYFFRCFLWSADDDDDEESALDDSEGDSDNANEGATTRNRCNDDNNTATPTSFRARDDWDGNDSDTSSAASYKSSGSIASQGKSPGRFKIYSSNAITAHAQKLFETRRRLTSKVQCAKCGKAIRIKGLKPGLSHSTISTHVAKHLGKPLFECCHCDYKTRTKGTMARHLKDDHQFSAESNYIDLSSSYESEIISMMDECFRERKRESKAQLERSVIVHCLQLIKQRPEARDIRCRKCNISIRLNYRTGHLPPLLNHICQHFGKALFACRTCHKRTITEHAVRVHLRKEHKLRAKKANYVSIIGRYREELIGLIDRCFVTEESAASDRGSATLDMKEEIETDWKSIEDRVRQSQLVAERHLLAQKLLQKFAKNSKIRCRMCWNLVNAEPSATEKAICHASKHIYKPRFQCKVCKTKVYAWSSVSRHMKLIHTVIENIDEEFDDLSNDYHQTILDGLSNCFDWSKDKD